MNAAEQGPMQPLIPMKAFVQGHLHMVNVLLPTSGHAVIKAASCQKDAVCMPKDGIFWGFTTCSLILMQLVLAN